MEIQNLKDDRSNIQASSCIVICVPGAAAEHQILKDQFRVTRKKPIGPDLSLQKAHPYLF